MLPQAKKHCAMGLSSSSSSSVSNESSSASNHEHDHHMLEVDRAMKVSMVVNSQNDGMKSSKRKAALIVQNAWRKTFRFYQSYKLVNKFLKEGPTSSYVNSISFEALTMYLRDRNTIAVSKACLQRIHILCTLRHGSPPKALSAKNVNVRVFLAGFMIAYHSTHVFESIGALENALLNATTPLITTFEKICCLMKEKHFFHEIPHKLTKNFPLMLFEYLKCFKAWKVPDEAKLICRIKHALKALYNAREHLPEDEPEDSKLKTEFRIQIERLRGKLQQIGGNEMLQKFDEEISREISTNQIQSGGAYAALHGRLTNEQLAHELMLDNTFELDEFGGCGVQNPSFDRIRESFHQAYWDSLVDDLRLPTPCYVRVLRALEEVRNGIVEMANRSNMTANNVLMMVDIDFIKQQAEAGVYDWMNCTNLVNSFVSAIQSVQARKRDEETKAKWKEIETHMSVAMKEDQPVAFCKAIEFLIDRVNIMRIDAANARIRIILPVIKTHGVEYERGKFEEKLKDGTFTLQYTEAWIQNMIKTEISFKTLNLKDLLEGKGNSFVWVHTVGMMDLVTSAMPIKEDTAPETLRMDVYRLNRYQLEFQELTTALTILVSLNHTLSVTKKVEDMALIFQIAEEVFLIENISLKEIMKSITGILKDRSSLSEMAQENAMRMLTQCASPKDAVHKLIGTRLRLIIGNMIQTGSIMSHLKEIKFMQSAKPIFGRFEKFITKLTTLVNINRTVHMPTYNMLINKVACEIQKEGNMKQKK